jgi:hypothetical protein
MDALVEFDLHVLSAHLIGLFLVIGFIALLCSLDKYFNNTKDDY